MLNEDVFQEDAVGPKPWSRRASLCVVLGLSGAFWAGLIWAGIKWL